MSGIQVSGLVIGVIGLVLTLTLFGAFLGIPMMIVGGVMLAAGGRPAQVIVHHTVAPQAPPRVGEIRDGHIYTLASDGYCYWYPMTEAERQQQRIRALEEELGM